MSHKIRFWHKPAILLLALTLVIPLIVACDDDEEAVTNTPDITTPTQTSPSATTPAATTPASTVQKPPTVLQDKFFGAPYIDVDEWRNSPVRHRYVHGGFKDTDTRFSFYLPPPEQYNGRMFQFLEGSQGGSEDTVSSAFSASQKLIETAFSLGGYLIESNQGHLGSDMSGLKGDMTILAYRASAETARYSKLVAAEMYGAEPHNSYVYGGSGGGVRSLNCIENVADVWDGAVPFVAPHASQGHFLSIQANAERLLEPKLAQINDAIEVGGSGDPFEGLTTEEAEALAALYTAGYPRGVPLDYPYGQLISWSYYAELLKTADPTYWTDFWTVPGYVGHDNPEAVADSIVNQTARVTQVLTAKEIMAYKVTENTVISGGGTIALLMAMGQPSDGAFAVKLDVDDATLKKMPGARLTIRNGKAAGRELIVFCIVDGMILCLASTEAGNQQFTGVQVGDEVQIDNRDYLAHCYWHRYQVQPQLSGWERFLVDDNPIYTQRPICPHPAGLYYDYKFPGKKMILVLNTFDRDCWPSTGPAYQEMVLKNLGQSINDTFRLWYTDHADHSGVMMATMTSSSKPPVPSTRLIDYSGNIQQALADLVDWVENGKAPAPSTNYDYKDGKITLADTAAERGGIQPVVTVTANSASDRLEVKVGTTVNFSAEAEVPPGAGTLIKADWDFEGTGVYPFTNTGIDGSLSKMQFSASYTYTKAGTYFPVVRVTSNRSGDVNAKLGLVDNMARIRVIVTQ
ncbi:MAG: tannase/feruloyl esterase family alpha/beta hydrolase [Dehalococcoidia bacterium]|nr:tannase/feruloyl esterase family alpha/beta hydrolase [Dehalococcoidia bacterium]